MDSSIIQKAVVNLKETEVELRNLIGEAASKGDYSTVEVLARWASSVVDMGAGYGLSVKPTLRHEKVSIASPPSESNDSKVSKSNPKVSKSPSKKRIYPFFAKSGNTLVKVAWSKSSKSEYQHKSPLDVLNSLVAALIVSSENGSIVTMEKVLPIKLQDGSEVPDYQSYVCLAWLRQTELVKQNGRMGYTVEAPSQLKEATENYWNALPEYKPS